MDDERDIVDELRDIENTTDPDIHGTISSLCGLAADDIECYRSMKDGFEKRANDYEDVIVKLVGFVNQLALNNESETAKMAIDYLIRNGMGPRG